MNNKRGQEVLNMLRKPFGMQIKELKRSLPPN